MEFRWFESGVKEAIHIRMSQSSLNKDGGRYNLPTLCDNLLKSRITGARAGARARSRAGAEASGARS